jgi:hypothetical protein
MLAWTRTIADALDDPTPRLRPVQGTCEENFENLHRDCAAHWHLQNGLLYVLEEEAVDGDEGEPESLELPVHRLM